MEALKKVELKDVPRGPMKLDDYGNPIQNIYVRKVEKVGGELQNTVIHTYPNVSQFWKYKPEEFLEAAGLFAGISSPEALMNPFQVKE